VGQKVDALEDKLSYGVAMAASSAPLLPTSDGLAVGLGGATYNGKSALSLNVGGIVGKVNFAVGIAQGGSNALGRASIGYVFKPW